MEGQPASPKAKLLEEIYVRGTDTIIRVSENAVLVTTSRAEGIQLPEDVLRANATEPLVNNDEYENLPRLDGDTKDITGIPAKTERIVNDEDLKALADNIDDDWRTLALCQLNVPATEVESIIQQTSSMRDQKFCMLRRWKTRLEQDATVKNLVAAIDQHVEKNKWKFLIGDEDGEGEMILSEDQELKHRNTHTVDDDEDARSTSTIESVELEPLSLVNKSNVTEDLGDVHSQQNHMDDEAVGLEEPNDNEMGPDETHGLNDDNGVLGDIERLSAVYTGFAEDKKDHFTSIGASMGGIMEKILRLDHENKKLKTENKRLKDATVEPTSRSSPDKLQTRPNDMASEEKQCKDTNSTAKHRREDFKKLRHNYQKIKAHLKEAVEANREWETFCRNKRDKHEKELREKMEIIKGLEEKVTLAESSSADVNRQMDSILNATENQATEIMKDLKRFEGENKKLKHEIKRLTEEKRKVEKLSRELLKGGGQTSERDFRRDDVSLQRGAPPTDDWPNAESESLREVLAMVRKQARAPPVDEPRKTRPKPPTDPAQEDIIFLKEQILEYRDCFEQERRDREKAASDLESLRKELEHTQMLLLEQQGQTPYDAAGKYGGAAKFGGTRREKKGIPYMAYMGPEEVERRRSRDDWY